MNTKMSVKDVLDAIEQLAPNERAELITILPAALRMPPDDYGWLKTAESTFAFWDNEDDAIYDKL